LATAAGDTLDVLVNNAGGALGSEEVAEADIEDWRTMYDVNVLGTLTVTQALLPALVASGDGVLINMGATAGRAAYEGGGYTAAKHGVAVLTETLRLELVGKPVRITEIAPGMVKTEEFGLVRFGGDEAKRDAVYAGVSPVGRRHRRRGRLGRHPSLARQHRSDGGASPRPGGPAQGAPSELTGLSGSSGHVAAAAALTSR
jgi:NADP-dependent 3-hydroxy acid dehydrogenase YdfG